MSISQPVGSYFAGKGYPPIVIGAAGASFLINLLLNIFLIPYWGITGASFSTSVAYTLHLLIIILAFRHVMSGSIMNLFAIKKDDLKLVFHIMIRTLKGGKTSLLVSK